MARVDIDPILLRVENLAAEIDKHVPQSPSAIHFRADLAGLLVVDVAACYESCVKEIINSYAARHHSRFHNFTQKHFAKLNSRISLSDLYSYARTFDDAVHNKFGALIKKRKSKISALTGKDFTGAYQQILDWRHGFAHAGLRQTTVEEAISTHRFARHVLYAFYDSFQ